MTISVVTMVVVSLLDNSERARREIEAFDDQFVRSQTGLGAEGAARH
jgi:cation/acetate symporter